MCFVLRCEATALLHVPKRCQRPAARLSSLPLMPRRAQKVRSKEALLEFARGGYRAAPALSVLKSPFGPIETCKAFVVTVALHAYDFILDELARGTPA